MSSKTVQGSVADSDDRLLTIETEEHGVFAIVADGLGGHAGGHKAAEIIVEEFSSAVLVHQKNSEPGITFDIEGFAANANDAIWAMQKLHPADYGECRSTVVLLHLDEHSRSARWGYCGDSRLYHVRNGELIHFTKDHTVAQMLVYDGELTREEISQHPDRNRITRCLGGSRNQSVVRSLPQPCEIEEGDVFLLCSDGWWENLEEAIIINTLAELDLSQSSLDHWLDKSDRTIQGNLSGNVDDRSACVISVASS